MKSISAFSEYLIRLYLLVKKANISFSFDNSLLGNQEMMRSSRAGKMRDNPFVLFWRVIL